MLSAQDYSGIFLEVYNYEREVFFYFSSIFFIANLSKLEFFTLDISGKNYLAWKLDAQIHIDAMILGDTIVEKMRHHRKIALKLYDFLLSSYS